MTRQHTFPVPSFLRGNRMLGVASGMFLGLAAVLGAPTSPAQAQMAPPGAAAGPTAVGVITLEETDVPVRRSLPGRAVAYEQTEIRPRVSGTVEEILYTPGTVLAAGSPLFRIEETSYRAAVSSARAQLASAEASALAARANADRYRSLQGRSATAAELQTAEAAAASAEAALASAKTTLELAELDLSRTTLTSPIAGWVGVAQISAGTLVTANQTTALTTVTRLDPIYIDFADSSAGMLRTRSQIESGTLKPGEDVGLELILENGTPYERKGTIVALSSEVSPSTGTVDFRVRFDNPDRMILPGQFLRVNMTLGTTRAILVPQRATTRASDGSLTAWVVRDGKSAKVTLTTAGSYNNAWIVTEGVAPGTELLIDGLTNMREGLDLAPLPVTIDARGVVQEKPAEEKAMNTAAPAPAPGN